MAIEVETKDCTAVTDGELDEMAELSSESLNGHNVGLLSKQTEEWVLVSTVREKGRLKGYAFVTLERIGGTPSVLIGLGSIVRNSKRNTVLRGLMHDILVRAAMAFPDEDVLVGTKFNDAGGFELFSSLTETIPRPGHKASGEERAWGRRLVKRFKLSALSYDDRGFVYRGDGSPSSPVFDHEALKPEKISADVTAFLGSVNAANGDHLVSFAWATAEQLEKLG